SGRQVSEQVGQRGPVRRILVRIELLVQLHGGLLVSLAGGEHASDGRLPGRQVPSDRGRGIPGRPCVRDQALQYLFRRRRVCLNLGQQTIQRNSGNLADLVA